MSFDEIEELVEKIGTNDNYSPENINKNLTAVKKALKALIEEIKARKI